MQKVQVTSFHVTPGKLSSQLRNVITPAALTASGLIFEMSGIHGDSSKNGPLTEICGSWTD
jgi:hypothetical protein